MPISPDRTPDAETVRREQTARCLLAYLEQLPLSTEARLELALKTLRGLPPGATPEQALDTLHSTLPVFDPEAYPPGHPPVARSHMPAQYLGRPRRGLYAIAAQWAWLLIVGLLIVLTLLLNYFQ